LDLWPLPTHWPTVTSSDMSKAKGGNKGRVNETFNDGITGNPILKEAPVGCTDAVCGLVEAVEALTAKCNKLSIRVGARESDVLTVTTPWTVDVGKVVAVATVGSYCGDTQVKKATVNGVETNGKLLDAAILGWERGSATEAVILPKHFVVGETAPDSRPGRVKEVTVDAGGNTIVAQDEMEDLSAVVKLSKEDRKAAQKAKLLAKKKAKAAANGKAEDEEEEEELVKASKSQLGKIKKAVAARRKAGEDDANTDDELEAAGFFSQ
jgi:hypothetical protein